MSYIHNSKRRNDITLEAKFWVFTEAQAQLSLALSYPSSASAYLIFLRVALRWGPLFLLPLPFFFGLMRQEDREHYLRFPNHYLITRV